MAEPKKKQRRWRLTGRTFFRELIKHNAEIKGDQVYVTFIKDFDNGIDEQYTYKDIHLYSNRLANGLMDLGIKRGDGVALFQLNSPEYYFTVFANMKLSSYTVLVNTGLVGDGLKYILEHSEAKAIISHWSLLDKFMAVRDQLPQIKNIIVDLNEAPDDFKLLDGIISLQEVMKASEDDIDVELSMDDLIMLMYTAGTTGLPKATTFYQGRMLGNLNLPALNSMIKLLVKPDDVIYTSLPLFHSNALFLSSLASYLVGIPLILAKRFSASRHWDICKKYGVTTFNCLGAMTTIIMKQPERAIDKEHKVREVNTAACPKELWVAFEKRFGVKIKESYGATDGGGFMLTTMGFENPPVGSMGRPIAGVIAEIMGENGEILPPDRVGELIFLVKEIELEDRKVEYFKDEKASESLIQRGADGQLWFHTGDLATKNEDGWFFFQDRKKDSIRRRGENIASFSVENIISQIDEILECAAYGVEAELGEDEVMISVILKSNQTITPKAILDYCQGKMAHFMVPRYIRFMEQLPKSEIHRVLKRKLKEIGVTEDTYDREAEGYEVKRT